MSFINRGCPVLPSGGFELFDNVIQNQRRLVDGDLPPSRLGVSKQFFSNPDLPGICTCPVGKEPSSGDGPTAKEFEALYVDKMTELEDGGAISSVISAAANIVEVRYFRLISSEQRIKMF